MKYRKYHIFLSLIFCLFFSEFLTANYHVHVGQSYDENTSVCTGRLIIFVNGDAGPFDITVYPSIYHIYSDQFIEQHLGVSAGAYFMEPIEVDANYEAQPVVVITDRFGCEYIKDDIILNCNCANTYIKHGVNTSSNAADETWVGGLIIYHPTDCFSNDGAVRFVSTVLHNAISPFTYEWSDPTIQVGSTFHTNIPQGVHTLTITDAAGCSDQVEINFKAENRPYVYASICPSCSQNESGYIDLSIGSQVFEPNTVVGLTIDWGNDLPPSAVEETMDYNTDPDYVWVAETSLTDLPPGTYCVTITENLIDENDNIVNTCDHVDCFTIEGLEAEEELYTSDETTTASCPFQDTGTFTMLVEGGIKYSDVDCSGAFFDYKYKWSNLTNETFSSTQTGMEAGDYFVTVSDFCGDEVVVPFTIEEFDEITYNITTKKDCPCSSSLFIKDVAGGEGTTIDIIVTGPNGVNESKTVPNVGPNNKMTLTGLCRGNYSIKFTDDQGCFQEKTQFVDAYPELELSIANKVNACLVNNSFFGNDIQPTVFGAGSINVNVEWSDNGNYSQMSSFDWDDATNHNGSGGSNINSAIDLNGIGLADFNSGSPFSPPGGDVEFFTVTVCTEYEQGVECCETISESLVNTIEVRTQPKPHGAFWTEQDAGCSCNLYVYCGNSSSPTQTFPVGAYRECDVLSDITGNISDCGEYICHCDFPDKYDELGPISEPLTPKWPLNCPEEQSRPSEANLVCDDGCQYRVECPDWGSILNNSWSYNPGPFQDDCDFDASANGTLIQLSNGCGSQDVTFDFEIDRDEVNCSRPVYVTTIIDGSPWANHVHIGNYSNGNHSWTLEGNDSEFVNPNYMSCGTIQVIFDYDNGGGSASFTLDIEFDDCQAIDVQWTNSPMETRCDDPMDLLFGSLACPVNVEVFIVEGTNGSCSDATGTPEGVFNNVSSGDTRTLDIGDLSEVFTDMTIILKEEGSSQCKTFVITGLDVVSCFCNVCSTPFNVNNLPTIVEGNNTDPCVTTIVKVDFGCGSGEFKVWAMSPNTTFNCALGALNPNTVQGLISNGTLTALNVESNMIQDLDTDGSSELIRITDGGDDGHSARKIIIEYGCTFVCVDDQGLDCSGFTNDDCEDELASNKPGETTELLHFSPLVNEKSNSPAVIFGPLSYNEETPVMVSVKDVSNRAMAVTLKEFGKEDNVHEKETVSHYAAESGFHEAKGINILAGRIRELGQKSQFVAFEKPFKNTPVVLATQISSNNESGILVRLDDVSAKGFVVRLQGENREFEVKPEEVSFMAFEQGQGQIGDKRIFVGKTEQGVSGKWMDLAFGKKSEFAGEYRLESRPLMFAMAQSSYGDQPGILRINKLSKDGVQIMMQGLNRKAELKAESLGYVIIESSKDCECERPIEELIINVVQPTCGLNDGGVYVSPLGGSPEYTWDLGNGPRFLDPMNDGYISNLGQGLHYLTITDSEGCEYVDTFNLVATELSLDGYLVENIECNGNEFNVYLNIAGGTAPFTYNWSNGSTDSYLDGVSNGNYTVSVTDADGCYGTQTFNLRNPYVYLTVTDETCNSSNGSLDANPYGVFPFTYAWSNGETTEVIDGLAPGSYTVTATDAAGCTATRSGVIQPNGQMDLDVGHPFCGVDNGSIEVIFEGVEPISYQWSNGASTNQITDLASGMYSVTVTDAVGCTAIESVTLTNTNTISISGSGGNEGLVDGRYFPAGVTIDWSFDPQMVTDQLIISSSIDGTIVNSGGVTRGQASCCSSTNCCSDFFLADHQGQTINLITGSGYVNTGGGSTCNYSGTLTGTFTTQSAGYVSIEVVGSNCGGNTGWSVALSCSGNSETIITKMEASFIEEEHTLQLTDVEEIEVETNKINVFPNPTSDKVIVALDNAEMRIENIELWDLNGKLIKTYKDLNSTELSISLEGFSNSVYLLKTRTKGGDTYLNRIIKN